MNLRRPVYKHIAGVLIIILFSAVVLFYLFNRLTKKSFYQEEGIIKITGLQNKAAVVSDSYGVPRISAGSRDDLYYALGFMHARDRLWQMDITRRIAEGRIAEIFGKDVTEYDKLYRTIGIKRISEKIYDNASPETREILESYCRGVNEFIRSYNHKLPLEFDMLNYKPEEWKPENSIEVVRMMGWQLNIPWFTDYMFGEIIKKFGIEKGTDFFPDYPEDAPYIAGGQFEKNQEPSSSKQGGEYVKLAELGRQFFLTGLSSMKFLGTEGTNFGSNSWVVNGSRTESGKPMLANDPHLFLQVPSTWYEVSLENESDGTSVSGFSVPGAPGVAIGTNGTISWGITNLMNDDSDFFILKLDPSDAAKYIHNDAPIPLDSTEEEIRIKGLPDGEFFNVYHTRFGPVVSRLNKTEFLTDNKFSTQENEILAFRWTGFEMTDEIKAFYDIGRAKNWDEFRSALRNFGLPASNFTYADVNGNIGYQAAGLVAVRNNLSTELNAYIPNGGEIDWSGFVPFDELPKSYNPPEGFIVSANNKPVRDYKYYISNLYEPHYRASRIREALLARVKMTPREFELLQNDVVSIQAREFGGYILEAFRDSSKISAEERALAEQIKRWDYDLNRISGLASLMAQFEIELYRNLFRNMLGEELFGRYILLKNVPIRAVSKILKENTSWLLGTLSDSLRQRSRRNELVRKCFRDAVAMLTARFGTNDIEKWEWGMMHKVMLRHLLGVVPALSPVLNLGPFDIGGSESTVQKAGYSFSSAIDKNEFETNVGASMRFVIDMSNTSVYYSILPTGQSGQPQHVNYSDQTRKWLYGEFKTVIRKGNELNDSGSKTLILSPE